MAQDRQSGTEIRDFRRAISTRLPAVASAKVGHFSFGFSLIELLVVMAIIFLLFALLVPAFTTLTTGSTVTSMANSIKGALENARTYAKANNTYVFVGFAEVDASIDPSVSPQVTSGGGRVAIATVASKDGTRQCAYSTSQCGNWVSNYNSSLPLPGSNFIAIGKLQVCENLHFVGLNFASWLPSDHVNSNMARSQKGTGTTYNIGTSNSVTPFSWPLGSSLAPGPPTPIASQYRFDTVINFDPRGVARIATSSNSDEVTNLIEIDFMQAHGKITPAPPPPTFNQDVGNQFVVQIDAPTGAVRFYRP